MAWFLRKKSPQDAKPKKRVITSNETEVNELRVRARRRLIGAVILVLFAIIVIPQVFDDPDPSINETPIVLPAAIPQTTVPNLGVQAIKPDISENEVQLPENTQEAIEILQAKIETDNNQTKENDTTAIAAVQQSASTDSKTNQITDPTVSSGVNKVEEKRSDDGSVALALLEGRAPGQADNNQTNGNFILQIAAYSTELDANQRRDKLKESGISNAYVEQGNSNNKTTYRLRVGTFKTREAAKAAQTRLRALGYDNSLLISQ